jgi:hypothetical protein|tara:strand:+ start:696 stop:896 length:201 start_codon:yes stop_codon:yes gene_type:complete
MDKIEKIVAAVRKEGEDHVRVTFTDMTDKVYRKQDWQMLVGKGKQFLLDDKDLDIDFVNELLIEKT